ncbi:oligosaccharide flippase family protein, partial [bacterium]|nr:oligosaccharide flippase family protein [bacterium]
MMWQASRGGVQRLFSQAFGSQLRRNMSSGVIAMGVNMLVLAISYPLYLRFLGYEKYGLWLVLATVLGFAQLGMLGIRQAIMKLVAEEYGRDNLVGVQSYVAMAWAVLSFTGTFVLIAILLFKGQIIAAFRLSPENAELALRLLPYMGFLSIYVFLVDALAATLAGLARMDLCNYTQTIGRIFAVGISMLLLYLGCGVVSLLIGNALSYVVINIISLVFIRRQAKMRFLRLGNWDWQRFKKPLSFGGNVFGGSLMNRLLDPFNKLMLSRYAGVASVPVYDIAFRGSMQIRALGDAGFRAIMPEISRIGANMTAQTHERIVAINRRAVKLIIICGVPMFAVLFTFAHVLLKFWL